MSGTSWGCAARCEGRRPVAGARRVSFDRSGEAAGGGASDDGIPAGPLHDEKEQQDDERAEEEGLPLRSERGGFHRRTVLSTLRTVVREAAAGPRGTPGTGASSVVKYVARFMRT